MPRYHNRKKKKRCLVVLYLAHDPRYDGSRQNTDCYCDDDTHQARDSGRLQPQPPSQDLHFRRAKPRRGIAVSNAAGIGGSALTGRHVEVVSDSKQWRTCTWGNPRIGGYGGGVTKLRHKVPQEPDSALDTTRSYSIQKSPTRVCALTAHASTTSTRPPRHVTDCKCSTRPTISIAANPSLEQTAVYFLYRYGNQHIYSIVSVCRSDKLVDHAHVLFRH